MLLMCPHGFSCAEARLAASESRYAGEEAGGSERTSTMQEVGEEDDAGGEEGDDWERGMTMGQEEEREEEENEEEEEEGAEVKGTITVAPEPLWWPQVPSLQRFCNLDIASRHLRGAERHLDLVMAVSGVATPPVTTSPASQTQKASHNIHGRVTTSLNCPSHSTTGGNSELQMQGSHMFSALLPLLPL